MYYWCTPHKGMGMIALVVVGKPDGEAKDRLKDVKLKGKSKKKFNALLDKL